jgi:hypothetical protein
MSAGKFSSFFITEEMARRGHVWINYKNEMHVTLCIDRAKGLLVFYPYLKCVFVSILNALGTIVFFKVEHSSWGHVI